MSPLIRPACATDIAAITAIYAHAVRHGTASFEVDPPDEAEMRRRHAALVGAGHPYLVAEEGGAVRAYAYAGPYRTRPAYRWTVEDSIYVAPDAQGRGLGRLMLGRLIEEAEAAGRRLMVAVIGDAASTGSIRLHEACAFRHVGTLEGVGHKHERWLSSVLMQRSLGPGTSRPPG